MDMLTYALSKKYADNLIKGKMDTTKTNANDCVPSGTDSKIYRVGNNASNLPIAQAGIIETFVYRDNGNVRVTQRYTVNYNTNGNPTYVRTAIGDETNLTWSAWSTFSKYSTNEIIVGQWINGKPIYRKVIQGNASFNNNNWTSITVDNTTTNKTLIKYNMTIDSAVLRVNKTNFTKTLEFSTVTDTGYGSSVTSANYTLIIEYIKATD